MPLQDSNPEAYREYQRTYQPAYQAANKDKVRKWQRLSKHNLKAKGTLAHTFVGVDGEGWTDDAGVHHYMCMVAGDDVLYTGKPLTTKQCLTWLAGLGAKYMDKNRVYVGFFFDYDTTMILRDVLQDRPDLMTEIVAPIEEKKTRFTKWAKYSIQYVPRKHLSVRLHGADRMSTVVVHDTRSFFQCSFVKALEMYDIGTPEQRDRILAMKGERAEFQFPEDADRIIAYCKEECQLLAELVGELRDRFVDAKLSPWPYEGPGPVAGSVYKARGFKDSINLLPPEVKDLALQAYYGGRFETLAHGTINGPVWEYDIRSAYPYSMGKLPCLEHGTWTTWSWKVGTEAGEMDPGSLWVGPVQWDTYEDGPPGEPGKYTRSPVGAAGPLPWRYEDGGIMFPSRGRGVYWSVEIPDYAVIDGDISVYQSRCDCKPFAWVQDMYQQRRDMEAEAKGSGLPLKLVLNSLYGKLAQRIGERPYYNPVWAGLITALTRRMVYDVYRRHPGSVVMFATDAVFVTRPCPSLSLGSGLGQWEQVGPYRDLTIFQPGVYFDDEAAKFKTRGVPYGEFRERASEFVQAANDLTASVRVELTNHLGIRQCLAWGPTRYHDLGNWLPAPRTFKMHPGRKRRLTDDNQLARVDGTMWSLISPGTMDVPSTPYDWKDRKETAREQNMWEEGLADHP